MLTMLVPRLVKSQLQSHVATFQDMRCYLEAGWVTIADRPSVLRDLRMLIRKAMQVPSLLEELRDDMFEKFKGREIEDFNQAGTELREAFEPGERFLADLIALVELFETQAGPIPELEKLRQASGAVQSAAAVPVGRQARSVGVGTRCDCRHDAGDQAIEHELA